MKRPRRTTEKRDRRSRESIDTEHWQGRVIEGRRVVAEFWGTLLLTLVATAAAAMHKLEPDEVSAAAAAIAPGAMVLAVIYFMGSVSGAHINPAVTFAFALRRNFPWIRVPGYIAAQVLGAVAGAALVAIVLGSHGSLGATSPAPNLSSWKAVGIELLLTTVLVNTILGTASHSGFLGPNAAIPVGSYIALAGLWAAPLTGASMNPARSIGPDLVWDHRSLTWIYLAGPFLGSVVAVGIEWALKGKPTSAGARAAQGEDHPSGRQR